ncbi:MAG TPA: hypothetical protein VIY51_13400 [Xanthobacteraceae bacterium]
MNCFALLTSMVFALPLAVLEVQAAPSMPPDLAQVIEKGSPEALNAFARRDGARTANVNRGHVANRNLDANRNINRNVNRDVNRNVNRNVNRAVVGTGRVAVGGVVRPWVRRPYYGTVVAGVALGTVIAATAVPPAPSSDLCWYWSNSSQTKGYWDYCNR